MKTIGITGSIASGKSTAARYLEGLGAHLVDADRLGHCAYAPGTPAHRAILDAFGPEVAGDGGHIDRRVLADRVFGRPEALKRLTDIVWPEIRRLAQRRLSALRRADPKGVAVLEAAMLFEAGWEDLVDEVWVVLTDRDTALRRARARDGSDAASAQRRIDAQISNEERARRADVVIENRGVTALLEQRLETQWRRVAARGGRLT